MNVTYVDAKAGINCFNIAELSSRLFKFFIPVSSTNLDVMLVPKRGRLYQLGFTNDPLMYYWLLRRKGKKDIFFISTDFSDDEYGRGLQFKRIPLGRLPPWLQTKAVQSKN